MNHRDRPRELHDRLSEHLDRVERGASIVVTRRLSADREARRRPWRGSARGSRSTRSDHAAGPIASREARARHEARLRIRFCRRAAPLTLYFDTSALVKLVVIEDGSELAADLWATPHQAASSVLADPEGPAALAVARRAGHLGASAHDKAVAHFEATQAELLLVGIDVPLARHAGDLAEEFQLRGYDAVHLASALALGAATTLVTWDDDLGRAALDSGCGVAPSR